MNERVADMGLTNTHFTNPHGWGEEGHYSTARDVATFVMYALDYPEFETDHRRDFVYHVEWLLHRRNTNKLDRGAFPG